MVQIADIPVKPRVLSPETGDAMPVDEVLAIAAACECRAIEIVGEHGSGRTTALEYLASFVGPGTPFLFLDDADPRNLIKDRGKALLVYTALAPRKLAKVLSFFLAPWDSDELAEYLLAVHPDRCRSVMGRLDSAADRLALRGSPAVWRIVLDAMAADESIASVAEALERGLEKGLPEGEVRSLAREYCLDAVAGCVRHLHTGFPEFWARREEYPLVRTLRDPLVQNVLAAEELAVQLEDEQSCGWLKQSFPRELIQRTAKRLTPRARKNVERSVRRGPEEGRPMAASLLHAMGSGWRPDGKSKQRLAGAYLDGASWPGIDLSKAALDGTDLSHSDLTEAVLDSARAPQANFRHAVLHHSSLRGTSALQADFTRAVLTNADARQGHFHNAVFCGANLERACFQHAILFGADLSGANLRHADLARAFLVRSAIRGADFSSADLTGANLTWLRLPDASFRDARFPKAILSKCDLESIDLPDADFQNAMLDGALLTASRMPRANFTGASLREAGMADIQWEGAILRDADLRGCTFHMGSTRSGLVGSPIASEGSRTGFYTDEFDQRTFRPPEEIRKANLRGADLRGANIDAVDFYLVDLRGALYTTEQRAHFIRCRAILEDRQDLIGPPTP